MKLHSFGLSDVGMRREKNEDSFLLNDEFQLYVVADGMGGHQGGEHASKLAVTTVESEIVEFAKNANPAVNQQDYRNQLKHAIQMASQRIFENALQDAKLKGMGTTSVVLLARSNKIYLANVGDSRGYLFRKGKLKQITEDHSLVQEQIKAGMITPKDAREHRLRNIITRSVGFQEDVDIDVDVRVARVGDKYLLCTDGLTNMVLDDEMGQVLSEETTEEACRKLIDLANARGGDDNITAVIIEVVELDPEDAETVEESTLFSQ